MASVESDAPVASFHVPNTDAGIVRRRHHLLIEAVVDGTAQLRIVGARLEFRKRNVISDTVYLMTHEMICKDGITTNSQTIKSVGYYD